MLLVRAAALGVNLDAITASLMRLLRRYGAAELQAAILAALERDMPCANAVGLALEVTGTSPPPRSREVHLRYSLALADY